jgi:D-serine deaminase-like pyridoxal phosphate-dependent protein
MRASPSNRASEVRDLLADVAAAHHELLRRSRTPCLVVDAEALRANCRIADSQAQAAGVSIRPHAKAHKCSKVLRAQLTGSVVNGITCATAYEAQALATLGFEDILIANEVVSRAGEDALGGAASKAGKVVVAVDSPSGIAVAARAARAVGREIGVLVEIDVGGGRCGVSADGDTATQLAEQAAGTDRLWFEGLQGYTGRGNYLSSRQDRAEVAAAVKAKLGGVRERLDKHGLTSVTVSGGSTGLFDLDQGLTEIQIGSYVLMEGRYAGVGLPFTPALFCAATVLSSSRPGHAVLDCGWKAMSAEFGFPLTPPGLEPVAFSDEHLICDVTAPGGIEVGDVVLVLPAHLDPTVNLHERLLVVDGGSVSEWPIDLRRTGPLLTVSDRRIGDEDGRVNARYPTPELL